MTTHWHTATLGLANSLGLVQPQVSKDTDWDRARAKRELVPLIRRYQGAVRFQDDHGRVWEPVHWWIEHEPLEFLALDDGAVLVAVFSCTGDCQAAARAFIHETVPDSIPSEIQRSETDTAAILVAAIPNHVEGKRYPAPLPPDLAPWYVYPADRGHCIAGIPTRRMPAGDPAPVDLVMLLTPIPVRTVQRLGYTTHRGFVVCPIDPSPLATVTSTDNEW
ncbi:hypothetical protein [Nocardia sp. CNY236]|uniref:hypothetical protein n=1 Tax=Nocardia sp. CNY236 TaxID=1169152 RepID=UPI00041D95B0|nr:hypothetical protein [Nocardia sp. CNY236]